jgi:FAD/FMN-containing dehydrogenase
MFSHMKNASYSPVTDSITLEPGIHWQEAVAALEPFGVAPVGGMFVYHLPDVYSKNVGRVG